MLVDQELWSPSPAISVRCTALRYLCAVGIEMSEIIVLLRYFRVIRPFKANNLRSYHGDPASNTRASQPAVPIYNPSMIKGSIRKIAPNRHLVNHTPFREEEHGSSMAPAGHHIECVMSVFHNGEVQHHPLRISRPVIDRPSQFQIRPHHLFR